MEQDPPQSQQDPPTNTVAPLPIPTNISPLLATCAQLSCLHNSTTLPNALEQRLHTVIYGRSAAIVAPNASLNAVLSSNAARGTFDASLDANLSLAVCIVVSFLLYTAVFGLFCEYKGCGS